MNATGRVQIDAGLEAKYEVLDTLGGGGMGRVLRARHRQLKRLVAIKLLHQDLRAPESVTRFLREARAAAQIRSAHIAHVLDAGLLDNGQPYIVMEYLQGQDLSQLLSAQGRLPLEQAVHFTLQALDALAEAHSLHIIHRDIKPGNLFATRVAGGDTAIKVVDFGLAKTGRMVDTLDPIVTERGAVLGTPSYMSPEQFLDAQEVDARADIWAVGATLFELLTGVPPFQGTNLPQVYTAVVHQPIPLLRSEAPDLPEGLEQVVATCLNRDRTARYANVAELAEALAPYASAAARDRIDRIRRVIDGVSVSRDSIEPLAEASLLTKPIDALVGAVSLTQPRAAPPVAPWRPPMRRVVLGLALASIAALTGLFWFGARTPAPRVSAPHPTNAAIHRQLPQVELGSERKALEPPVGPLGTTAPALQPTPPPTEVVTQPTAKKTPRAKTSKPPKSEPTRRALYDQYP